MECTNRTVAKDLWQAGESWYNCVFIESGRYGESVHGYRKIKSLGTPCRQCLLVLALWFGHLAPRAASLVGGKSFSRARNGKAHSLTWESGALQWRAEQQVHCICGLQFALCSLAHCTRRPPPHTATHWSGGGGERARTNAMRLFARLSSLVAMAAMGERLCDCHLTVRIWAAPAADSFSSLWCAHWSRAIKLTHRQTDTHRQHTSLLAEVT